MSLETSISDIFPRLDAVPAKYALSGAIEQREYLVEGEIRIWEGAVNEVLSPVCLKTDNGLEQKRLGFAPSMTGEEAKNVSLAAAKAYDNGRGEWPTMPVSARIKCVENFIFKMTEKRDEIVKLLMWEIGKTLADSEKEFDRTIDYVRNTIDAVKELDRTSSRFSIEEGIIGQIRRAPLGVTLCMGPFNYPLNETFTTLIPALIMGNPIVFKPAKFGVLLHRPLLEAFRDSFPRGVVNTIYGDGRTIIGPIMETGQVAVLAFIGTSKVANTIRKQHPKPNRLRCVLGLDAKNPAIVLPDADIDLAVKECVLGSLSYNGQRCTAIKMTFVHSSIADAFIDKFSTAVSALKLGMPWDEGVKLTPLPELGKPEWLKEIVDEAVTKGARIFNPLGGTMNKTYFHPAVLYPVSPDTRLWSEEQFGPVVPIAPFDDIETPIKYVEESNFGQQVSIFGNDPDRIASLIDHFVNQLCRVNVNSQCQRGPDTFPFTGRKDSAEGTLSVTDALRVFTIRTLVAAKETDANKKLITDIVSGHKSHFLSTDFIL